MTTLALVVPVLNQHETFLETFTSFAATASKWEDIEVLVIDNGSYPPVVRTMPLAPREGKITVLRNQQNIGVLPALQQGYLETKADWIFFTHSDVLMYEPGWDTRILRAVDELADVTRPEHAEWPPRTAPVGVLGFFGATGFGSAGIYRTGYSPMDLVREDCVATCPHMSIHHGHRRPRNVLPSSGTPYEEIAVVDGFAMIVNRKFLDQNGGFDPKLPVHHMYDAHTCLQAAELGYRNYVIGMDADHYGGRTAVREDWATALGLDGHEVFQEAHQYVYDYWHPTQGRALRLPCRVPR
jgi:GT2 family glycosyltransferase